MEPTTNMHGDRFWKSNGEYHRDDGPAFIGASGAQFWYNNGKIHREDGPAIIFADGGRVWYINGKRHRECGPAIICANGDQAWYNFDNRHRVDGPAMICTNGDQYWYINGELRREPHNGEPMPVILEKRRASFDGRYFKFITTEEYDNYKYQTVVGKRTKAALREN